MAPVGLHRHQMRGIDLVRHAEQRAAGMGGAPGRQRGPGSVAGGEVGGLGIALRLLHEAGEAGLGERGAEPGLQCRLQPVRRSPTDRGISSPPGAGARTAACRHAPGRVRQGVGDRGELGLDPEQPGDEALHLRPERHHQLGLGLGLRLPRQGAAPISLACSPRLRGGARPRSDGRAGPARRGRRDRQGRNRSPGSWWSSRSFSPAGRSRARDGRARRGRAGSNT